MQASRIRRESRPLRVRDRLRPAIRAAGAALGTVLVAAWATGCGHRATKAECEEIFTRSAELALAQKDVRERTEVDKQVEQARVTKGDKLITECMGRRITEDAMECVRRSESPQGLEACLD